MLKKAMIVGLASVLVAGVVLGVISLARPSAMAMDRGQGEGQPARADVSETRTRGRFVETSESESPSYGPNWGNQEDGCEDCDGAPRTGNSTDSTGFGRGNVRNSESLPNQSGNGRGDGVGRGRAGNQSPSNPQADVENWITYEGIVVGVGDHVTIQVSDGSELELGMGPLFYREEIGFEAEVGDRISVTGYYEDGEFKVGTIERSGETFLFRDEYGRPLWAGRGRRSA